MQDWEREFLPAETEGNNLSPESELDHQSAQFDDHASGVLAEIDRLQRRKANWGATLLVLIVSGLLFYWIGSAAWNLRTVALLIPILLFHELGHYLAMLTFGYRNLRMFFIPLFGAAVTGRNYNVAAWKKAVVSLSGPLPGIALGGVLGIVALVLGQKLLLEAAMFLVFLNGINLLPILPLDGGWNLHAILFSRHYLLDVGFRLVAAVLMILGGVVLKEYFLTYLGAAMLFGLPMEYRRSQIVARLRREHFAATSLDSQTIPEETARRIIDEVHASFPKRLSDRNVARLTLQIFESLNARPPGWFAVVALAGVHFVAFVVAVVFSLVFSLGMQADLKQFARQVADMPKNQFSCGTVRTWRGAQASDLVNKQATLIATFADRRKGEDAFGALTSRLPASASAKLFGQSILVTLPADGKLEKKWMTELQAQCPNVRIDSAKSVTLWTLVCIAPTADAAQRLEREANGYFALSRTEFLTPAWFPSQSLTAEQHKARTTYAKVEDVHSRILAEPRYANESGALFHLVGKGKDAIAKMKENFERIQRETVTAAVDEVRREGEAAVDFKLLDLYMAAALPNGPAQQRAVERAKRNREMGQRMGQLPLENGKPKLGDERFSASGHVQRTGLLLRFDWLWFKQVGEGLPALAEWLCSEHCIDFKYRIEPAADVDDGEDEAAAVE